MKKIAVILGLMIGCLAYANSRGGIDPMITIGLKNQNGSNSYMLSRTAVNEQQLRDMLRAVARVEKERPVIQIELSKGKNDEVSAKQLLKLLDILRSERYQRISFATPYRVGMRLERQPVALTEDRKPDEK